MNSVGDGERLGHSWQNFQCEIFTKIRTGTRKLCPAFMVRNLAQVRCKTA